MSNTYKDKGLTGKSSRKMLNVKAQALVAPVVEEDEVSQEIDPINETTKSGKQKGAMVIVHIANKILPAVAASSVGRGFWFTPEPTTITQVTPV